MGLFGSPSMPSAPKPSPPATPPDQLEALARLARQRKSLEAARMGRKALRVDLNPGMTADVLAGLRIP